MTKAEKKIIDYEWKLIEAYLWCYELNFLLVDAVAKGLNIKW